VSLRRTLRRLWRSLWFVAHLALGALLCALWLAPLARLAPAHAGHARERVVRFWMRTLLAILGVRVRFGGTLPAAPVLLVANHVSWLDIPCLFAVTHGVFVAKSEVARWPLIGALAAAIDTIFLERGHAAAAAAERMTWRLMRGERVLIFPEGTSTDGSDVRVFHARLYQAAVRAGCPVQAVAISYPQAHGPHPRVPFVGDDEFVRHLWRLLGEAGIEAQLQFCPPLPAAVGERRQLAVYTRDQVRAALGLAAPARQVTR
jgi:1-acyl-sn-glycerol-3-phosphate acyltransferase